MFHENRNVVTKLKVENGHFAKLFEKHNELDDKVTAAENGSDHISDIDCEILKKEKLKLKDEMYAMILEYKKAN